MKLASYWLCIVALAAAAASIAVSSGQAQPILPVQTTAPGISTPAPAPPLDTAVPNPTSTSTVSPPSATIPLDAPHQETLEECMSFWDAGTHMSKTEWRRTCQRTLNGQIF